MTARSSEMIVWGGLDATGYRNDGGRYDPATGQWTPIPAGPLAARELAAAVWTGQELIVWGGRDATGLRGDGAVLDLRAGRWLPLPEGPAPRQDAVLVAVGARALLLWGADDAGLRTEAWALDLDALGVTARGP